MASKLRLLTLAAISLIALLLVACGSDSADNGSAAAQKGNTAGSGVTDAMFVSNGPEVLGRSATAFADHTDVNSVDGSLQMSFDMGAVSMNLDGSFAYQSPDQLYMTVDLQGGSQQSVLDLSELGKVEVLARDGKVYIKIPVLGGWYVFSPQDLGATSGDELQKLLQRGSVFDYPGLIQKLTQQVTFVGKEDVDGHETAHYQFEGTLGDLISDFTDAIGSTGDNSLSTQLANLGGVDGPVTLDVWVGTDDLLPYKITATSTILTGQAKMDLSVEGTFSDYNQPVSIPAAPADAVPFGQALGRLTGATAKP